MAMGLSVITIDVRVKAETAKQWKHHTWLFDRGICSHDVAMPIKVR